MSDDRPDGDGPRRDEAESDREDPFDRLGPDVERDGDPFERLDADAPESGRPDAPESGQSAGDGESPVDPWSPDAAERDVATGESDAIPEAETTPEMERTPEAGAVDESFDADDPFAHVETPSESPFDGAGSPFERVDSGAVDPDQVWAEITADDAGDADGEGEPPRPDGSRYSEVSKHRFCEGCEHFSAPPDVSCDHETAEIIEFLDTDTVRLLDCPVVAEREALERRE